MSTKDETILEWVAKNYVPYVEVKRDEPTATLMASRTRFVMDYLSKVNFKSPCLNCGATWGNHSGTRCLRVPDKYFLLDIDRDGGLFVDPNVAFKLRRKK